MSTVTDALTEQDIATIRSVTDTHVQAILDHDSAAFIATCADDIVFLPPEQEPVVGRAACKEFLDDFPQPTTFTANVEEIEGCGDLAFSRGHVTGMFEEGETTLKFMAIHRRQQDGSWKMTRDMWSTNHPAP